MLTVLIQSIDASLGRINPSILTEQQVMELFFTPTYAEDAREDLGGDENDACTWSAVSCTGGVIEKINWTAEEIFLQGSIDFSMVPRNIINLVMENQDLSGTVDTRSLPDSLEEIRLSDCPFTGTLDLGHLPYHLRNITVWQNNIDAVQNICDLPPLLHTLDICERNVPAGSPIHVGKIPSGVWLANLIFASPEDFAFASDADKKRCRIIE